MHLTRNTRIQKWLTSRQMLVVALQHLCSHRPFWEAESITLVSSVQEFCQLLIDYASLGHFEMYEHVINAIKTPPPLLQLIFQTTHKILDFNDRYKTSFNPMQLERDLSVIAENLAHRFEWEDALIKRVNKLSF